MFDGLKDTTKSSTFWTWLISVAIQIVLPLIGVHIPGSDAFLGATVASGPTVYGIKEGLKNLGKGEGK